MPLVSIIIPCFNQGRYLPQAIESALAPQGAPSEIIVVDDGSTDDTPGVAARYDVRYTRQPNAGPSAARNRGLQLSSGKYVVFLDADDRLLPGALEAGLQCLSSHPECAFVYGRFRHISADGTFLRPQPPPAEGDPYLEMLRGNHIGDLAAVMFRRWAFDVVGGFDPTFHAAVDYELYLRVMRLFPVRAHPHIVAEYRKHGSSLSDNPLRMLRYATRALRRERSHVAHSAAHRDALEDGMRSFREYYLDRLGETARAPRSSPPTRLVRRLRYGAALLRYHPRRFAAVSAPRLYCAWCRQIDVFRNMAIRSLRTVQKRSTGRITATPNPARVGSGHGSGSATISWRTIGAAAVEVRVGTPQGPLFSSDSQGVQTAEGWIRDGTRFYLIDASDSRGPHFAEQLAVTTVNVLPSRRARQAPPATLETPSSGGGERSPGR